MADGTRVYAPDSPDAGPLVDTFPVVLPDGTEVARQRVALVGSEGEQPVPVLTRAPDADDPGLVVRAVPPQGRSTYNISTAIAPGSSQAVVEALQDVATVLHGFTAMGTGDGVFHLMVNDAVVSLGQIDNLRRSVHRMLPAPIPVPQGAVVRLMVRCVSEKASCTYEASVYTEVLGG